MLSFIPRGVRSVGRGAMLLALLLAAIADGTTRKLFFGMRPGPQGAVWVHRWCRRIVRALGLQCEVEGSIPPPGTHGLAIVSNHLSYLDILVYSALQPMVMVSKTEVRRWPLIGWITAQAGTVYVQRADVKARLPESRRQSHAHVNAMMANAYRSGLPVLFYPEGTTTDGLAGVLPFRRGLFNSAVSNNVPVRTAAIGYQLGPQDATSSAANSVCFWGDAEFGPHLLRLLGLQQVRVRVRFGEDEMTAADRFALASNAREAVEAMYEGLVDLRPARAAQGVENLFDGPVQGFAAVDR